MEIETGEGHTPEWQDFCPEWIDIRGIPWTHSLDEPNHLAMAAMAITGLLAADARRWGAWAADVRRCPRVGSEVDLNWRPRV